MHQHFIVTLVLFACVHNAGRSQMAAAFFNQLADAQKVRAISAGTSPGIRVHPELVTTMREVGLDLEDARPERLTPELASSARHLITMGCGDECPFVPGAETRSRGGTGSAEGMGTLMGTAEIRPALPVGCGAVKGGRSKTWDPSLGAAAFA